MRRLILLFLLSVFLPSSVSAQSESIDQIVTYPAVGAWNGFLQHLNVVECNNYNQSSVQLTLSVQDNAGVEIGNRVISIAADGTLHTVLNEFPITDSFGTYKLTLNSTPAELGEKVICYTIIYRLAAEGSGSMVEYAFALPLRNSLQGETAGLFNSFDPEGGSSATFNWLSVVNTGDMDFTADIITYSQSGEELDTIALVSLAPGARRDFALGHDVGQRVGLYRIVPGDPSQSYQAFLSRYAERNGEFRFAFPLQALSGSCNGQLLSLSTYNPADNWVEIANFSEQSTDVTIEVRQANGDLVHTEQRTIGAFAQSHFFVNPILGEPNTGSVRVLCEKPLSDNILVQSLFYGLNGTQVQWAYGAQADGLFADAQTAQVFPVNTYLGMQNWLKQFNSSAIDFIGKRQVATPTSSTQTDLALATRSTRDEYLNGEGFSDDEVGSAQLYSGDVGSKFRAELLRVFLTSDNTIDSILHIPARVISRPQILMESTIPLSAGIVTPVHVVNAGDGSGRLFVIEKGGLIKVFKDGAILPTPFLDLSSFLPPGSEFTELGVQNMVFHPQYSSNGRLFVVHNDLNTDSRLTEYTVSIDPDVADPASERTVLTIPRLSMETFHNGGGLTFGPDSYLYWAMGDMGPQEDLLGNGQNTLNLAGSLMRIDVDGALPYAIPADNPFVGDPNVLDEIWAFGFRNPWRVTFDPLNGRMFIGDVGQVTVEEVSLGVAGGNFGWNIKEGTNCFNPPQNCESTGLIEPIHDYPRKDGASVIGGFVYRGTAIDGLDGSYIFGDFVSGRVWLLKQAPDGSWERSMLFDTDFFVTSFGQDEAGEPYLVDIVSGVYKLAPVP